MKILGIIGGMGTLATLDFFEKIITNTDAHSDKEHVHTVIDNDSTIPDRTAFILGGGIDPTSSLISAAKNLEKAGADYIVMPCNTAHYFFNEIKEEINIPMLHMIEETAKEAKRRNINKLGLLSTKGTYKTDMYKNIMKKYDIDIFYPSEKNQDKINDLIYDIKSDHDYSLDFMEEIISEFKKKSVVNIILGCTELPVVFDDEDIYLDPTLILAKEAIRYSGHKLKEGMHENQNREIEAR